METMTLAHSICPWCGDPFTPRHTGGKPQRFCSTHCPRDHEAALRAWAQDQFAQGKVSIADLQRARCQDDRPAGSGCLTSSGAMVDRERNTRVGTDRTLLPTDRTLREELESSEGFFQVRTDFGGPASEWLPHHDGRQMARS